MLTSSSFSLFIEVYSTESSKVIGYSSELSNFNRLVLKLMPRSHPNIPFGSSREVAGDYVKK